MGKKIKFIKDKDVMITSSGAGCGIVQAIFFKEYGDTNFGTVPFIDTILPSPWNRYSTFLNILLGGISLGIGIFTNINSNVKNFLVGYGTVSLIGGITYGIFPGVTPPARARMPAGLGLAGRSPGRQQLGRAPIRATTAPRPVTPRPGAGAPSPPARVVTPQPRAPSVVETPTFIRKTNKILA